MDKRQVDLFGGQNFQIPVVFFKLGEEKKKT